MANESQDLSRVSSSSSFSSASPSPNTPSLQETDAKIQAMLQTRPHFFSSMDASSFSDAEWKKIDHFVLERMVEFLTLGNPSHLPPKELAKNLVKLYKSTVRIEDLITTLRYFEDPHSLMSAEAALILQLFHNLDSSKDQETLLLTAPLVLLGLQELQREGFASLSPSDTESSSLSTLTPSPSLTHIDEVIDSVLLDRMHSLLHFLHHAHLGGPSRSGDMYHLDLSPDLLATRLKDLMDTPSMTTEALIDTVNLFTKTTLEAVVSNAGGSPEEVAAYQAFSLTPYDIEDIDEKILSTILPKLSTLVEPDPNELQLISSFFHIYGEKYAASSPEELSRLLQEYLIFNGSQGIMKTLKKVMYYVLDRIYKKSPSPIELPSLIKEVSFFMHSTEDPILKAVAAKTLQGLQASVKPI